MRNFLGTTARILLLGVFLTSLIFQPQSTVFAAPVLTITPATWDVIGLDSNNVNTGPNNFPVGARVCNTGDQPATNVTATFVWDSANVNINLRPGVQNPFVLPNLPNGSCYTFYFGAVITRTAAAYDTARQYHIDVTADGLGTVSTPTPRELYVERLVSQNRNSVIDVQIDGVSIAAGGTMNMVLGNTYTITLYSDTATNGYEQIEAFINFPNSVFEIVSVSTTYTADAGTDPDAAIQMYADGCGWDNATRSCTGTGKYGGAIVTNYVVRVIGGAGTSQTLNTLIYDFSGSSYHYNTDFDSSFRIAVITDASACTDVIAQWDFTGGSLVPSTGVGTFTAGVVTSTGSQSPAGNTNNPAIGYTNWTTAVDASRYLEFAVSTVGFTGINFSFGANRFGNNSPTTARLQYSTNGTTFTNATPDVSLNSTWADFPPFILSSATALDNNPNAKFRIQAFGNGGTQANRAVNFDTVTIRGCALPPAINLSKEGVIDQTIVPPPDETNVGDRINYTLIITNTGGVPLTNIILTDNRIDPGTLVCNPALAGLTLLPGQSTTCTGYHTLTQADFDNGLVTNTATADSDQVGPVSDSTTQILPQSPALTLEKTSDIQIFTTVGQQVTYTYTLTNTGNVTLTAPYAVTDDKATVDCSGAASPLAPGESTTCTATYTITQADIDAGFVTNLATATATFGSTTVTSNEDSVTVNFAGLNIIKEVSTDGVNWVDTSVNVNVGDTVYYRIRVQNTGNVTLTGFTVDDGMAGCTLTRGADDPGDDDADFEPGETWVYTCSVIAIEGTQNNTATADSNETEQDSDDASYFGANPAMSVVKSETSTGPYSVGDTITYDIVVTNTGNVTLTNVTVSDNSASVGTCTPTQPSTLNPGESMTCPASHVVTLADVNNGSYVNTATGDSNETPPADSTVTVNFAQNPALSVVKSETSTGPYSVGDTITYNIVVTNTGNVTLTGVTVSDNSASIGVCTPPQPSTLAPGESMTCPASHVVTLADVNNGSYVNTATGDSNETPPEDSTVTVNFAQNPALSVVKSETSTGPYSVGDTITYNIVVTNTGNVTLTGVTVNDTSATVGTCTPPQPSTLNPGESMTCPANHVVTQTDVNNGSYVNTATGDSNETPPADSTVTITLAQNPALSVVKSETSTGPYSVGDTITYNIVVTNTGNVTLTNVTVSDNSASVGTCTPAQPSTLNLGESMTCPASHVVTLADVNNGSYVNTATGDSNETPPADSTVTITLAQNPALSVVKSETSTGPYSVGDTITYNIVVTNTGNVTLTGVTVSDNSASVGTCTPAQPSTLNPGESMTCPASHVVTLADVNNGSYVNTATGDSNETPPEDSTVTITLAQNPGIQIIKSSNASGTNSVGDTITYTYEIENIGDVTLTNVTVTDAHAGLSAITCTPAQGSALAPGETMTCTATYVVTQADVDAGQIDNTGVVTGTPPSDPNVTDEDPLSEPVAQGPALDIVKSQTSNGPYTLGDTITYDIVVTNTGNVTLTNVTVSDNSATLGTCTPPQPSTLSPGESMTCPASHVVTLADLNNGSYVNTATADSNETPPEDSTVTVDFGVADLSLVKTVTNTTPPVGTNINFILTLTNSGPDDAVGVEVGDVLPSGFTFISASASRGSYNSTTGIWVIGDVAVNESVTLNMTVRVNASGSYTNTAQVIASLLIDPDSTPNNNNPNEDDQSSVTINPRANNPGPGPDPDPDPIPAPIAGDFLIPVTGFAQNVVTDLSNETYTAYSNTTIALDIPSLSVNIPIVGVPKQAGTWNVSWLGNQAGWLEGSAFPSWNGNSVLTSHVYLSNGKPGPFAKIHELRTGDQIVVHAFGQQYIFEVQTNAVIAPNDRSVMQHEERPWLTLVTCADYNVETGVYESRFIVRAVLVKVTASR